MDKKLIKLAKEGDQDSIETICAAFKGLVINIENNTAFEPYIINSVKNNFFLLD